MGPAFPMVDIERENCVGCALTSRWLKRECTPSGTLKHRTRFLSSLPATAPDTGEPIARHKLNRKKVLGSVCYRMFRHPHLIPYVSARYFISHPPKDNWMKAENMLDTSRRRYARILNRPSRLPPASRGKPACCVEPLFPVVPASHEFIVSAT